MCLSEPQTAVAITRMRTSACPGVGTGTVLIAVAPGPGAAFVLTTACMVLGRLGDWGTGGLGEGALFLFPPVPPSPVPQSVSIARLVVAHETRGRDVRQ